MDGHLYMNATGYYHGLPSEQGKPLEVSLSFGMGIYANWLLPIYCMFAVQESNIVDSTAMIKANDRGVQVRRRLNRHCAVRPLRAVVKLDDNIGNAVSMHEAVSHKQSLPPLPNKIQKVPCC